MIDDRFCKMTPERFVDAIPHLVAMGLLIVLSGLVSGSETALFALTKHQINRLRKSNHRMAGLVQSLRARPADLLSTVLLANITINILLYSILAVTTAFLADGSKLWTAILGVGGFLIVLVGAEIAPKLIAFAAGERLALFVALPIRGLEIVTSPIRWLLIRWIVEPLTRILSGGPGELRTIHPDELQQFVHVGRHEGIIDESENALLHQVMELKDMRVSAIMVPRVDVIAFNLQSPRQELINLIRTHRLLRIPVYEGDIDNIKGIIRAKDFLLDRDRPIERMIQKIAFIPEQASVEALLDHFRKSASKLALVVDEYGGVAGIVALEDVVEAIVGEIYAPDEAGALPALYRLDNTTYLLDAGIDADEFRRAFGLPVEETRFNTVAGLIAEQLGRLPKNGDSVVLGHATLTVTATKGHRVVRARVNLEAPVPENPDMTLLLETQRSAIPHQHRQSGEGQP
jgi:putative hemolysin